MGTEIDVYDQDGFEYGGSEESYSEANELNYLVTTSRHEFFGEGDSSPKPRTMSVANVDSEKESTVVDVSPVWLDQVSSLVGGAEKFNFNNCHNNNHDDDSNNNIVLAGEGLQSRCCKAPVRRPILVQTRLKFSDNELKFVRDDTHKTFGRRFSAEEDATLVQAVQFFGINFQRICETYSSVFKPRGRDAVSLKNRWYKLRREESEKTQQEEEIPWSEKEELALLNSLKKLKSLGLRSVSWIWIRADNPEDFKHRSPKSIHDHWKEMLLKNKYSRSQKHGLPNYQTSKKNLEIDFSQNMKAVETAPKLNSDVKTNKSENQRKKLDEKALNPQSRGVLKAWKEEEEDALFQGVKSQKKIGCYKVSWNKILADNPVVFRHRTATSLKLHWLYTRKRRQMEATF